MTRWFKRKQKERNRIEGHFGHGKEHYGLDRMGYHGQEGSEIWTRGGILAMNLMTALARGFEKVGIKQSESGRRE